MSSQAQWRLRLTYGVGSVGTGIFTTVPTVLLLYYLTIEAHIDAALAGLVILIPKAMGLIGDPLIGAWSDRLRRQSPFRRQILMGAGALIAGCGLWALFSVPEQYPRNEIVPALIFFTCTTGYSMFAVPYSSLPGELDYTARGRRALVSTRLGLAFFGVLVGGVCAPLVAARNGYPVMGLALGAICVAAMGTFLLTCQMTRKFTGPLAKVTATAICGTRDTAPLATRPFLIQMGAFVLLLMATGAFSSLLPFLIRDMMQSIDVVGFAMLVNVVIALLTSLIWPTLIDHLGLRAVWQLAAGLTCLSAVVVGCAPGAGALFYVGMAIGGAALSGVQIAGFTSLADLTAERLSNGLGGGLITGIWMAGEKVGLAGGPMLAGTGIQFLGTTALGSGTRSSILLIPAALAAMAIVTIAFTSNKRRA